MIPLHYSTATDRIDHVEHRGNVLFLSTVSLLYTYLAVFLMNKHLLTSGLVHETPLRSQDNLSFAYFINCLEMKERMQPSIPQEPFTSLLAAKRGNL